MLHGKDSFQWAAQSICYNQSCVEGFLFPVFSIIFSDQTITMKYSFLILSAVIFSTGISAQLFKKNDAVQVDTLLSEEKEGKWQDAVVTNVDTVNKKYSVKLANGNEIKIPYRDPGDWIRPVINRSVIIKYGPGARLPYKKQSSEVTLAKCNASELNIKKNIRALMAKRFSEFPDILVDFTSFKGQHGYEDKNFKGQQVYPYKIEMLVHLRRSVLIRGQLFTEYQTWELEQEYEYASRPKKKCEFKLVKTEDDEMSMRAWY